jgi:hypothetical protein
MRIGETKPTLERLQTGWDESSKRLACGVFWLVLALTVIVAVTTPARASAYSAGAWPGPSWNMFFDLSPWNTPINPASVDPNSGMMIRKLVADGPPAVSTPAVRKSWGTPLYFGRARDPLYRLRFATGFDYTDEIRGRRIHIPRRARPSKGNDGVMWVVDQTDGFTYVLQQAVVHRATRVIHARMGYRLREDGLGFRYPDGPPTGVQPIRPEELAAGYVNHAMSMEVECLSGHAVAPFNGSRADGHTCAGGGAGRLNLGNVVFLDMTHAQIDALHLPRWEDAILKGLADHGAVVGLNGGSGHWALKFENPLDRTSLGKRNPYAAVGVPAKMDFAHALHTVGGWGAHLKVLKPFPRPCSGVCP